MASNEKTVRNVVIVIGVLLIVGLILFFVLRKKAPAATTTGTGGDSTGGGSSSGSSSSDDYPLTLGSRGAKVKALQQAMNRVIAKLESVNANVYNLNQLTTDGIWGQKTQYAFTSLAGMLNISLTAITSEAQYQQVLNACNQYAGSDGSNIGGSSPVDIWNMWFNN